MKFIFSTLALVATAFAAATNVQGGSGSICGSGQSVVCKDNGNGGLITLGNVAPGLLGDSCGGGDVYCCKDSDIGNTGLINLDVNAQCTLNHVL